MRIRFDRCALVKPLLGRAGGGVVMAALFSLEAAAGAGPTGRLTPRNSEIFIHMGEASGTGDGWDGLRRRPQKCRNPLALREEELKGLGAAALPLASGLFLVVIDPLHLDGHLHGPLESTPVEGAAHRGHVVIIPPGGGYHILFVHHLVVGWV